MDNPSPVPNKPQGEALQMTFPEIMKMLIKGARITKLEWNTNDEYCMLRDGWLKIHKNGQDHIWQVNDGDLLGTDWVVMPEQNPEVSGN